MTKQNKIYEWSDYLILPYYSKSYCILYPLLGFIKEEKYDPSTYLFWEESESIFNFELLVFYENPDEKFEDFERNKILSNSMLKTCYSVEGGMLYIFDLCNPFADDVALFIEGRYSKMSDKAKKIIKKFHGDFHTENKPIKGHPFHMLFSPNLYYDLIRKELGCEIESIRVHGELWDRYSADLETFKGKSLNNCDCTSINRIEYKI